MDKNNSDFTTQLMAFTFFYSVAIYTMAVGVFLWSRHSERKRNK